MRKNSYTFTVSQFAELHEVNKRTLHYYDSIHLFSPAKKAENGYRYYDVEQSVEFEYLRMLRELDMSVEEILEYRKNPNIEDFLKIAEEKLKKTRERINRLKDLETALKAAKQQAQLCKELNTEEICLVQLSESIFLSAPFTVVEEDLGKLFAYLKEIWGLEQCRMRIGSYLSVEKVLKRDFSCYDGLFTVPLNISEKAEQEYICRPEGTYLCGYQKGSWEKLPLLYEKMMDYASRKNLILTGYAWETGMNDFFVAREEEYLTQVFMQVKK